MRKMWLALMLVVPATTMWADDDPPSRVARLNFLEGPVSFQAAGSDDWSAATVNYPLTVGDHLWADDRSHAELHIGSTAIRLDAHTALAFLNLDDRMTQLRLSDGTISISIRYLAEDESYEVDTPNGSVTLLRPGKYRIDADPDRQTTSVTVRAGEAEVTAGGSAFPIHPRQTAYVTGTEQPNTEVSAAGPTDDFDGWWEHRDEREERRPPPRYVSREMIGSEDLDDYGTWRDYPEYGHVWVPRVEAGWAPYRFGHWAWVGPWGWTWVDDAPWGFAPFHYGRWAYYGGGWIWAPGVVSVRPVYAPALVAWVGGSNWGVSVGFGGGGGVGWFPLGPREAYIPSYRVSNTYVTRVNVTNVTNVTNITNVTNVRYVNQNVPGAVTAVSRTDFAASRPVGRVAVAVPQSAVASATVSTRQIPVTREQAVMARPAVNTAVARPPQSILQTRVVTKTPPPAATATLARPAATGIYQPRTPSQPAQGNNRPGQPTPAYRPPTQSGQTNQPTAQPQPTYRPPAQTEQANRPPAQTQPAYRPPAQSEQTNRPPAQSQPAYRPPAQSEQTYRPPPQSQPGNRPPARSEETYRPPPQSRSESMPRHGPAQTESQPRPQNERRAPPPAEKARPEKSKEH